MVTDRFRRARRFLIRATAAATLFGLLALLCFFPFAGRYLYAEDPLEPADAIFVLAGARAERWLEAVDLYREKIAPIIVLSSGRGDPAELRLQQMGIRFPSDAELARDAMIQMHVPADAISILPTPVDNTAAEAGALRKLLAGAGWQRLMVVTSRYHTRRAAFAFRRELRGLPVRVLIRATRYDMSTPSRWWTNRADFRFVTSELQKLLAYRLGLGG